MSKADVEKATKTDNAVFFDGKLVPCGIVYKYTEDDLLEAVYVRISPSVYSDAPKMIISYLGEKRVDITSEFVISEHIWFYPDYYVFLDFNPNNNKDKVYITVALYNSKNYRSIPELALYGGCSDYDFRKPVLLLLLAPRQEHINTETPILIREVQNRQRILRQLMRILVFNTSREVKVRLSKCE